MPELAKLFQKSVSSSTDVYFTTTKMSSTYLFHSPGFSYTHAVARSFCTRCSMCGDRLLTSPCLLCFFVVVSGEIMDLRVCICIHASQSLCTHMLCATAAAARHWPVTDSPTQFPTWLLACDCGSRYCHCVQTVGAISGHFSSQRWSKDRQCCESRDVELGVCAVWAVSDMTAKDR